LQLSQNQDVRIAAIEPARRAGHAFGGWKFANEIIEVFADGSTWPRPQLAVDRRSA
jgi:hypothetical protein